MPSNLNGAGTDGKQHTAEKLKQRQDAALAKNRAGAAQTAGRGSRRI